MTSISLNLRSAAGWKSAERAKAFVAALKAQADFWMPEQFDAVDPAKAAFDPEDLERFTEIWLCETSFLYLARRHPYRFDMILELWSKGSGQLDQLLAMLDARYCGSESGVSQVLEGAKALYRWGGVAHGYIAHEEDWNAKNYFGVPTEVAGGKLAAVGGTRLEESLPGIYWANFFGPLYVEFFGRDRFEGLPAYAKQELADGGFLVLTAEAPGEYGCTAVRRLEEAIIDHLGRDAFFEKAKPGKLCRAPRFDLGPRPAIVAHDPTPDAIPDPSGFVKSAKQLARSLCDRLGRELDYSAESLGDVDRYLLKVSSGSHDPWTTASELPILLEATAYYGEVLRRSRKARWMVLAGSDGIPHPALVMKITPSRQTVEYPFTRVLRLWSEREPDDGLASRYRMLEV